MARARDRRQHVGAGAGRHGGQSLADHAASRLGACRSRPSGCLPGRHPDPPTCSSAVPGLPIPGRPRLAIRYRAAVEIRHRPPMKMFLMGVDGGRPAATVGVQPGWFYKGDGTILAAGTPLRCPTSRSTAARAGDRRHLGDRARRHAVGWAALGNEFSDHVTECNTSGSRIRTARGGPGTSATCRGTCAAPAASTRRRMLKLLKWARRTCRSLANLNIIISNMPAFVVRRRPRHFWHHLSFSEGVKTLPAIYSRSKRRPSACRCATADACAPAPVAIRKL